MDIGRVWIRGGYEGHQRPLRPDRLQALLCKSPQTPYPSAALSNKQQELHQYLGQLPQLPFSSVLTNTPPDQDGSGTNVPCVSPTIGSERLNLATPWLRQHGKRAVLGETAGTANPTCIEALKGALQHIVDNDDVWAGHLLWASGPWWGNCKSLLSRAMMLVGKMRGC